MQSQLGTINSTLAAQMALGIPVGPTTDKNETVNQAISFVSSASVLKEVYPATSNLGISDAAVAAAEKNLSASSTLAFTDVVSRTRELSVSQTLSFVSVQSEFNYVADRQPVGSVLNFVQTVITSAAVPASSTMTLTQSVAVQAPIYLAVNQYMGISSRPSTPHRRWVEDSLGITDRVRIPIPLTVTQTISFVQDSPIGRVDDLITFTQSASGAKGYVVKQEIDFVHANSVQGDFIRLVEQESGLIQTLTFYEDTPCFRKQYHPFQGEGATPPDNLLAGQGQILDRFSLYQPVLGPRSLEVILRAPEMDDRDRNAYNRVQGETRGGRIRVFADPIWPKVRTLAVTITGITEAVVDELQTFLDTTLGQQVGITDWKGNLWSGTVMNPSDVATQDGRGRWTVSLEIEAEPVDTVIPVSSESGQPVAFSQTVGVEVV